LTAIALFGMGFAVEVGVRRFSRKANHPCRNPYTADATPKTRHTISAWKTILNDDTVFFVLTSNVPCVAGLEEKA
jgi:hypothetical protein